MSGEFDYVLDEAFDAPRHFLNGATAQILLGADPSALREALEAFVFPQGRWSDSPQVELWQRLDHLLARALLGLPYEQQQRAALAALTTAESAHATKNDPYQAAESADCRLWFEAVSGASDPGTARLERMKGPVGAESCLALLTSSTAGWRDDELLEAMRLSDAASMSRMSQLRGWVATWLFRCRRAELDPAAFLHGALRDVDKDLMTPNGPRFGVSDTWWTLVERKRQPVALERRVTVTGTGGEIRAAAVPLDGLVLTSQLALDLWLIGLQAADHVERTGPRNQVRKVQSVLLNPDGVVRFVAELRGDISIARDGMDYFRAMLSTSREWLQCRYPEFEASMVLHVETA